MKIKNLKYILCFAFFVLFSLNSAAFSDSCSDHPASWYGSEPAGNNAASGYCWSYETNQNSSGWYNNDPSVSTPANLNVFLSLIGGYNWSTCDATSVKGLQMIMQRIWWACSTCIDWKAWKHTRDAIPQCVSMMCPETNEEKAPKINGDWTLYCDDKYYLETQSNFGLNYKCCFKSPEITSVTITKTQRENGKLRVEIKYNIIDDDYDYEEDNNKISATNENWNILVVSPSGDYNINNGVVTQDFIINADISSQVTVNVFEWLLCVLDDDGNIIAESPAEEETFNQEISITGPTIEQTSWNWNTLVVNIAYELVWLDSPSVDCRVPDKIEIVWWTQNGSVPNASVPSCQLTITTEWDEVTINVKSWVIVWGGMESSPWSQTLTKPQQCGSTPKTDSGCDETYWPSYTLSGICCVTQCSTPQKTWWGCNPWYSKDDNGCCVANNCQNLPAEGNDCSNWWWMWSYSEDSGCCVKWESCLNPATPPTNWQCVSPYVFDQAGECCTNCSNPLHDDWTCDQWYTAQWGCCFPDDRCWENQINQWWQCKACEEEWTKPNEAHTRCICNPDEKCCGVQLNNVVPFIGDCIEMNAESSRDTTTNVNSVTAFPILMQWLMKILMSVIMIFSFLMIIVAWLMIVSWAFGWNWFATWKKIIKNVIISLILLWCSGLILSLINPSFFGG